MTETLANGYSSESTLLGLFNEYQHDSIKMVFKNLCVLVLWTKISLAVEGLILILSGKLGEFLNLIYLMR